MSKNEVLNIMSSVSLNNTESNGPTSAGESLKTLMNSLHKSGGRSGGRGKPDTSETGSSNGGNNSDNSALVSLGNTSFGFNFDSEESNSKEGQNDSNEDSDGNVQSSTKQRPTGTNNPSTTKKRGGTNRSDTLVTASSISSSNLSNSHHGSTNGENLSVVEQQQLQAAADAVASLESIARAYPKLQNDPSGFTEADNAEVQRQALERKRKAEQFDSSNNKDADSGGYNTDDDEEEAQTSSRNTRNEKSGSCGGSNKSSSNKRKYKTKENESKREERNQREKERSFRISKQITELRDLLSSGGVVVPKGTKSSVLTEAASYIRMLQQHQYRSEM
jgi:hypothetical protein